MPFEAITVAQLDTDVTPYDVNTNASSSTVVMGLSVQRAAQDLKRQILRHAARMLKTKPEKLALRDGKIHGSRGRVFRSNNSCKASSYRKQAELIGHGAYQDIKSRKRRSVRRRLSGKSAGARRKWKWTATAAKLN